MKFVGPMLIKSVDYSKASKDEKDICKLIQIVNITQQDHDERNVNILQKIWKETKRNFMQLAFCCQC